MRSLIKNITKRLSFWEAVIPDTNDWNEIIPSIHQNNYGKYYKRFSYSLKRGDFAQRYLDLPKGYVLEEIDVDAIRNNKFTNPNPILKAIDEWGSDMNFRQNGGGAHIHNQNEIVSYSLWECTYQDKVEIGINTLTAYRKKGYGLQTALMSIKSCYDKGYNEIGWKCTEFNKGSRAIAEKIGFKKDVIYDTYTPYPPIENMNDWSEEVWNEWAVHYETYAKKEPRLWGECLLAYIKANNIMKASEVLLAHRNDINHNFNGAIMYLHKLNMATSFSDDWM